MKIRNNVVGFETNTFHVSTFTAPSNNDQKESIMANKLIEQDTYLGKNARKILGYIPGIGLFTGIKKFTEAAKPDQDYKVLLVVRGVAECFGLGILFLLPDLIKTAVNSHQANEEDKAIVNCDEHIKRQVIKLKHEIELLEIKLFRLQKKNHPDSQFYIESTNEDDIKKLKIVKQELQKTIKRTKKRGKVRIEKEEVYHDPHFYIKSIKTTNSKSEPELVEEIKLMERVYKYVFQKTTELEKKELNQCSLKELKERHHNLLVKIEEFNKPKPQPEFFDYNDD